MSAQQKVLVILCQVRPHHCSLPEIKPALWVATQRTGILTINIKIHGCALQCHTKDCFKGGLYISDHCVYGQL